MHTYRQWPRVDSGVALQGLGVHPPPISINMHAPRHWQNTITTAVGIGTAACLTGLSCFSAFLGLDRANVHACVSAVGLPIMRTRNGSWASGDCRRHFQRQHSMWTKGWLYTLTIPTQLFDLCPRAGWFVPVIDLSVYRSKAKICAYTDINF